MRSEFRIFVALLLQQLCTTEFIPVRTNENNDSAGIDNVTETIPVLDISWAFSSVDLTYLAEDDMEIYIQLSDLRTDESISPEQLKLIERWVTDYEASNLKEIRHLWNGTLQKDVLMEAIVAHPLLVYRMVRRFVKMMPGILNDSYLVKEMTDLYCMADLPDSEDLGEIMASIIRLSETYSLNPAEIIRGQIGQLKTNVGLTLEQAFEIAKHALKSKVYTQAYYWLVTVCDLARSESWIDAPAVLNAIDELTLQHNALIEETQKLEFSNSSGSSDSSMYLFTTKITEYNMPLTTLKQKYQNEYERGRAVQSEEELSVLNIRNYELLCDGRTLQTKEFKSKLYCWYEQKQNLAWIIGPLKMELLDKQINLVQIHDIIGDAMIEYIKGLGAENLERAKTVENTTTAEIVSNYRTSSSAFLIQEDGRLTDLDRKIEKITGLMVADTNSTFAAEPWQVASSAIAGHYEPHYDMFTGHLRVGLAVEFGDRISTFMIYLNDVELGGHTVFTAIGVSVKPQKGSALFWYNLKRNGNGQTKSMHAGCPVLYGQKWVANKWILEHANFQKRSCSLDPEE